MALPGVGQKTQAPSTADRRGQEASRKGLPCRVNAEAVMTWPVPTEVAAHSLQDGWEYFLIPSWESKSEREASWVSGPGQACLRGTGSHPVWY